jgi:signal transduction histidine kinase
MPYKPEKIKVSQVFQEVSDLVDGNLKMKNITLEKHLPPDLVIIADSASFNTVLRNLISNAIKFSHPEGKIVLSAEKVNSNTLFSVKDQGVGIDPEKLEVLFTLNKKSNKGTAGEKGTGLGLILCKELVELNKGEILVESEFGKGSTFSFTIPNVSN